MLHARDDYERIQDLKHLIPDDEPVFLLRGQDKIAWYVVRIYAWAAELCGLHEVARLSHQQAERMMVWAGQHGKFPDIPRNRDETEQKSDEQE